MRRRGTPGLTRAALTRHYKDRRVYLVEHDGDLWLTHSYHMVRVQRSLELALVEVLADHNLMLEPMAVQVGRTWRRIDAALPGLDQVLAAVPTPDGPEVEFARAEPGGQLYIISADGDMALLAEGGYALGRKLWDHLAACLGGLAVTWHTATPLGSKAAYDGERRLQAVVMPIRLGAP